MAFRLCLAFCLLAAAAASMVRSTMESRLRGRLRSDSWVARANAAVLLADNPRAVSWLLSAAEDEAPPVRRNARWALHRLTGLPWANQAEACASWWKREHSANGATGAAPPAPEDEMMGFGVHGLIVLQVEFEEGALTVSIESRLDGPLEIVPIEGRDYCSILFSNQGSPVRIIDPPEPAGGVVETRIRDGTGRLLQTWYWNFGRLRLEGGKATGETYDLSAVPPGRYVVECVTGPFAAGSDSPDWNLGVLWTDDLRRVVIIDR